MKSKTLLVSNIIASLYDAFLLIWFVIINGDELNKIAKGLRILGSDADFIIILLWVHIILFTLGCIFAWIGYAKKKSGKAKAGAFMFLFGTICFPVYFFICIPIVIVAFVAAGEQKKNNKLQEEKNNN